MNKRVCWLLLLLCFQLELQAHIDLDTHSDDFVLETKKIEIPGYPHAFNPSIVRWQGSLLMSFREIPNPRTPFTSWIGLVWLDDDFQPLSAPQRLTTEDLTTSTPSRAEDARLLMIGDQLYMVYSDCRDEKISKGGFRLYLARIEYQNNRFTAHDIEKVSRWPGASSQIREKNWVPFEYEGNLLLAYSLTPHRILRPILGTGECEEFVSSQSEIDFNWGVLRGGTAALRLNDEHYLSIYHSVKMMTSEQSDGKEMLHYFMGAYLFDATAPFAIQHIGTSPILAKGFYTEPIYKPYWHPIRAVFPCGLLIEKEFIWVTYGRQDHECWVIKLDKNKLLNSLMPVQSCPIR